MVICYRYLSMDSSFGWTNIIEILWGFCKLRFHDFISSPLPKHIKGKPPLQGQDLGSSSGSRSWENSRRRREWNPQGLKHSMFQGKSEGRTCPECKMTKISLNFFSVLNSQLCFWASFTVCMQALLLSMCLLPGKLFLSFKAAATDKTRSPFTWCTACTL